MMILFSNWSDLLKQMGKFTTRFTSACFWWFLLYWVPIHYFKFFPISSFAHERMNHHWCHYVFCCWCCCCTMNPWHFLSFSNCSLLCHLYCVQYTKSITFQWVVWFIRYCLKSVWKSFSMKRSLFCVIFFYFW